MMIVAKVENLPSFVILFPSISTLEWEPLALSVNVVALIFVAPKALSALPPVDDALPRLAQS